MLKEKKSIIPCEYSGFPFSRRHFPCICFFSSWAWMLLRPFPTHTPLVGGISAGKNWALEMSKSIKQFYRIMRSAAKKSKVMGGMNLPLWLGSG